MQWFPRFSDLDPELPSTAVGEGGFMGTKRVSLLLAMSLCGFWGCAPSKPLDTVDAPTQPAVETAPPVDQNREQMPAPASPIAEKPAKAPVAVPEVNPSKNAVTKPQTKARAHEESPKVAAKNETTQRKAAEMKVANEFDRNPYLSLIVKPILPPRTNMMDAAAGFKDQRQFIAAVHLSKNLGIPFNQIKMRMTGEHRMSLNDSLRDFRPQMTKDAVKAAVKKAEQQAKADESRAKDDAKKAAAQEKVAANRKS